ncbi:MAG: hypothetical protein AABX89_08455 [Candidatus Thermoplasmatota archaeon]
MRAAAVVLVLAFALAGCAGSDSEATNSSSSSSMPASTSSSSSTAPVPEPVLPSEPATLRFDLLGCSNFGATVTVPSAEAQAQLPAGFTPIDSTDVAGGSVLYLLGLSCDGSRVNGNETGPATLAYAELAVVPSTEAKFEGRTDCTVPLFFASDNAAVGAVLEELQLGNAGSGDVSWSANNAGDVVVAASREGASVTLRGVYQMAPAGGALGSGNFVLYGVQEGALRSTVAASYAGGTGQEAALTFQSTNVPTLGAARPVARGFSVQGFDLHFEEVRQA